MKMQKLTFDISLNGKYPRSEKLIQATRDFEKGKLTSLFLEKFYSADYRELQRIQSGFTIKTDGLLQWQDLLRPLSELIKNTEVDGLIRYFETNTFYRFLHFHSRKLNDLENWFKTFFKFGNLAILPSPYFISRFSKGLELEEITQILSEIISFLTTKGYEIFYLQEPALVYYNDKAIFRKFANCVKKLKKNTNGKKLILNTYFKEIGKMQDFLLSLEVDGIGIDFTFNDVKAIIKNGWNKDIGLLAGVLDTSNSLMESKDEVIHFVNIIFNELNPSFLLLSGSADFEFLPREIADKKVVILKEVKEECSALS